jgi:TRAP-type transport system small permease protein
MDFTFSSGKNSLLFRVVEYIASGILGFMVVIVGLSVVSRYLFNISFRWSEEVSVILFIFLIFLAIPIVLKRRLHICIDFFVSLMPNQLQRIVAIAMNLIVIAVALVFMITSGQVILQIGADPLPATYLPRGIIYGAAGVSGVLILIIAFRTFIDQVFNPSGRTARPVKGR